MICSDAGNKQIPSCSCHAISPQAQTVFWQSTKHNMGMSFNRDVWKKIRACSKVSGGSCRMSNYIFLLPGCTQ